MNWSNTLKQFVGILPTNYLSVFDHFVGLALRGLSYFKTSLNNKTTVSAFSARVLMDNVFIELGSLKLSCYRPISGHSYKIILT